jgi:hypothetical protein
MEEFVRIWQSSDSPAEVAKKAGYKRSLGATSRAAYLRKLGVKLKRFPTGPHKGPRKSTLAALEAAKKLASKLAGK